MRDDEAAVIGTILLPLALEATFVVGVVSNIIEPSLYVVGVPTPTDPQVAGRRTVERQLKYTQEKRSKWRGPPEEASHVKGEAIHLGLRYRASRAWIPYERMDSEQRQVFMILVDKMEARGWTWGGRWRTIKDWHHFEKRGA